MIKISIINNSLNELPVYATTGSSGMDIRAFLETPVTLLPLERYLVPTGIFVEIPPGYELQIRPRSGLALKNGITCLNSPGTIDSDYRGEIKVLLINLSNQPHSISNNERIAQMVLMKIEKATLTETNELNESVRSAGGFGHTGVQ